MKKRLLIICTLTLFILFSVQAQTQRGYVKTLGRPGRPGEPLSGVTVRVKGAHNAMLSQEDGTFSIDMTGKKTGDAYALQQVRKSGYELNESDVIGRQFAYSEQVPLTLVMVSSAQLQADKQRIEANAYQAAERNYQQQYNELEQQLIDSLISAEKYREQLQALQNGFEHYQALIAGLAEHYAHLDYDALDEKEREISECIENGELERADSLLQLLFDPTDVLQRNMDALAELDRQIAEAQGIIDEANTDMAAVLKQQEKDAEYLYQLYTIALSRFDNVKAFFYIETRAELDSTNLEWQNAAGSFAKNYMADYGKALFYFQRALRQVHRTYEEENNLSAALYNNIATVYENMGDYQQALKYHNIALDIRKSLPDNELYLAESYFNICTAYSNMLDLEQALYYVEMALELYIKNEGENHRDVGDCYNNIGNILRDKAEYDASLEYHFKALAIRLNTCDSVSFPIAESYNNIANTYYKQGKYHLAEDYMKKALQIHEKIVGKKHPTTALYNFNLAFVSVQRDDYQTALERLMNSASIWIDVFGEQHQQVGMAYKEIGRAYMMLGDYSNALEYGTKAIAILESAPGAKYTDLAEAYSDMGVTLSNLGDAHHAVEYYLKEIELRRKHGQENDPGLASSYSNLSSSYMNLGEYDKALEYSLESLRIRKTVLGESHPDLSNSYNNVACSYFYMGDYAMAEAYFNQALALNEMNYGIQHTETAISYLNIGSVNRVMGNFEKAVTYTNKAISIFEEILGEEHPRTIRAKSSLVKVYTAWAEDCEAKGDVENAAKYRKMVQDIQESIKQ